MYMRMGHENGFTHNGVKTHIHLDSIALYTAAATDDYIAKLKAMRDALWDNPIGEAFKNGEPEK